jgi:hypothetical protein
MFFPPHPSIIDTVAIRYKIAEGLTPTVSVEGLSPSPGKETYDLC